jgi:hypothetical protein
MTTLAVDHRATLASRVIAMTRLQLTVNPLLVVLPIIVVWASFAVTRLSVIGVQEPNVRLGGLMSIYFVQLGLAAVGGYQSFGHAVGLNVTRRAFYLASVLTGVLQSVLYGLMLYLAGILERATDGWGARLRFFDPTPLTSSNSPVTVLVYAVPLLFTTLVGLFLGALVKRFGPRNVILLSVAAALVLGLVAALITYLDGWAPIVGWLARQSPRAILTGWLLVPTALAGAGGWLVLRRAVP